jgi:Protein of unknown function (DUF4230)
MAAPLPRPRRCVQSSRIDARGGHPHISSMKQIWTILLSLILLTMGAFWWVQRSVSPPVEAIVASSLQSLHEQNRLSPFATRFVTVVTSRKEQLGFAAEKTLIMPAMVRYEVDLAKVQASDLDWNAAAKTLTIHLPPVEISGPEFDLAQTREYGSGAVLMTLTDAERLLDQSNRAKAKADVIAQAKAPTMIKLAQDATTRAVAHSFALPLKAAGVEANVEVEFEQ